MKTRLILFLILFANLSIQVFSKSPKEIAPIKKQMISRQQATEDIDSLIYMLSDIHPNIYTNISPTDLLSQVENVKRSLPDSIDKLEFYSLTAPIVTSIGDGHTSLWFPISEVSQKEILRFPLMVNVNSNDSTITTRMPLYGIPNGAKILSINGIGYKNIIEQMLPYVSGERIFLKLKRIDGDFIALFMMLFRADKYDFVYMDNGIISKCTLPAVDVLDKQNQMQKYQSEYTQPQISYRIVDNKVAIMTVPTFTNINKLSDTCREMFTELNQKNITSLIIDVRDNGGGTSMAVDTLLSYIAKHPFKQYDKVWCKVTPLTQKLTKRPYNQGVFYDFNEEETLPNKDCFDGQVWLLINHCTFSAAASFAWTVKAYGIGTLVGEETGGMNVSYGDYVLVSLPNSGLQCSISFKRFWLHDADEKKIHGALPDIEVSSEKALECVISRISKDNTNDTIADYGF